MVENQDLRSRTEEGLESLLEFLKEQRGFDFTGYKRTSLTRRLRKRMAEVGVESFDHYRDYLEAHPREIVHLFDTVLINVTDFFRDPNAWQVLAEKVVPALLATREPHQTVRVWSAGCSTGQEAYSLAIVLAEALGWQRFKQGVKIYATDVDEEALAYARRAAYTEREVEEVPPELRERYFERGAGWFVFRPELRRRVIVGRNDLVQDAPISQLDLLVCRNTLMYFHVQAQYPILARFHSALNDTGFLFLGRAEMLLTRSSLFRPVDMKTRIFASVHRSAGGERLLLRDPPRSGPAEPVASTPDRTLLQAALDFGPHALIVVDIGGIVRAISEEARSLFQLSPRDVGRPLRDLEVAYRPLELRSRLEQACAERRAVHESELHHTVAGGGVHRLELAIVPLVQDGGKLLGANICFTDVTRFHPMKTGLHEANERLEDAYEELQSTTEEIETINDEPRHRTDELNRASSYIPAILASPRGGGG